MKTLLKNKILYLIIIILIIFAVSLKIIFNTNNTEGSLLDKYQLTGLSVEEMVSRLDKITNESKRFKASITGTKLIISEGEFYKEYSLPEDKFYVSIAPYINDTHGCEIHSLSGCKGEISDQIFEIDILSKDGSVIYSKQKRSMENGFIGIWLPKNIEAEMTIKYFDKEVKTNISTYVSSNTCITTPLRLKSVQ